VEFSLPEYEAELDFPEASAIGPAGSAIWQAAVVEIVS
jgi:hypothetical protein